MTLISDHLRAASDLLDAFRWSNLDKDIADAIKAGRLFLPPPGFEVDSCSFQSWFCYRTEKVCLSYSVALEGYDEDQDEQVRRRDSVSLYLPYEIANSYTVRGGPGTNPFEPMRLTFSYSKRALNAWIKERHAKLVNDRLEELDKERAKMDKEIKTLGRTRRASR